MPSKIRKQHFKDRLDAHIQAMAHSSPAPESFWRLIHSVRMASRLLSPHDRQGSLYPVDDLAYVRACARMATHSHAWVRAPESWHAPSSSQAFQFRSLASHLFDQYPVPNFMSRVWCDPNDMPWEIDLYLHLAAGRSIRKFAMPFSFELAISKSAAAWYMQAPDDLGPIIALRWAQVRSLGGDTNLARTLSTCAMLAAPTTDEPFWQTVINFLIRNQPITTDESVAIVDFIHQQKYQPAKSVLKDYCWQEDSGNTPLQPDFSLKGRTLRSLRRHVANWLAEVATKIVLPSQLGRQGWQKSALTPLALQIEDQTWSVEELLTRESLVLEGSVMKHCVASYTHACHNRRSSIWSMRLQHGQKRIRSLTIEVAPARNSIWQAKGFRNSRPTPTQATVLREWAKQNQLRIENGVL